MDTNVLHAFVVHKHWVGDTSVVATFFTLEHGLLKALCKGGRTPKKQSLLQCFMPLWVNVRQRGDHYYVQRLEPLAGLLPLKKEALFASFYANELLLYALRPLDSCVFTFEAYEQLLQNLVIAEDTFDLERALRRFEWCVLCNCGYEVSLSHDTRGEVIEAEKHYDLLPNEGFVRASQGILGRHILAFAHNDLTHVQTLKAVKQFMRRAIEFLLEGKVLKSRALFRKYIKVNYDQ